MVREKVCFGGCGKGWEDQQEGDPETRRSGELSPAPVLKGRRWGIIGGGTTRAQDVVQSRKGARKKHPDCSLLLPLISCWASHWPSPGKARNKEVSPVGIGDQPPRARAWQRE